MLTSKQIKAEWKEEDGWYQNPDNKLRVSLGDWVSLGNGVSLGNYVSLGNDVRLISISHKYIGTLAVSKEGVLIRIGCEVHPAEQWDAHGAALAAKHLESEWWEATGKYMLELLKVEDKSIEKELK